jgi:hypothetical protein
VILWKTSHSASEGDITTTAPSSIDPARFLHDQAPSTWPSPKLRSGSYFPDWLLERRRRAEAALTSVVAAAFGQTWDPGEDDGF